MDGQDSHGVLVRLTIFIQQPHPAKAGLRALVKWGRRPAPGHFLMAHWFISSARA